MTPENLKPDLLERLEKLRAEVQALRMSPFPFQMGRRDVVRCLDRQNDLIEDLVELVLQHDASLFSIATALDAVIDEKITITKVPE